MKKYYFFFFAIQLCVNGFSQTPTSGQLKIIIESFKCLNQSWDGFVEFDGHGNEVFINYGYRVYNPSNPSSMKPGAGFTSVYGSAGNGRIQAGTASAIGGIANGNVVMVNTPVLNERVEADNLILFSPSVWEWDNSNNNTLNLYNQQLATDLNWVMGQPYPFLNTTNDRNNPYNGRFTYIGQMYRDYRPIVKYSTILNPLINVQNNRPVGAGLGLFNGEKFAIYNPAVLILDAKVLMEVYSHNKWVSEIPLTIRDRPSRVSELVEMVFTENTYAIVTSNGSYSLKLKIEFTPDAPAPAPASPPKWSVTAPAKTIKMASPGANFPRIPFFVNGTWSGTQTNDSGLYPQAISFQLTNTGEFIMADQSGTVAAKGSYSIVGNIFSGSFKQFSDSSTYSFSGTYDGNTQIISGSLGSDTATTGQGKWTVTKQ